MKAKRTSNADVARALREMALFLEMEGVAFKPQAYEKAAYAVLAVDRPLAEIHAEGGVAALDELPGIGKGIAERIAGMLETGTIADLEAFRKKTPSTSSRSPRSKASARRRCTRSGRRSTYGASRT